MALFYKVDCCRQTENTRWRLRIFRKNAPTSSRNYKKLLEIVEEMTIINMTLLKENACL